jgi:hypothetical protein
MMTRPVAVARSVIVTGAVWGFGAAAVAGVFAAVGASSTIELGNGESRVQLVWLGAHAFVACAAALVGVALGGSALTRAGLTSPREAVALVGPVTLLVALVVAGGLRLWAGVGPATITAMAVGLLIGTLGATFFVAQTGEPETGLPYRKAAGRGGRSWSSR